MKREWKWVVFYSLTVCAALLLVKFSSRFVSVIAENQPIDRKHCIIIDPGHGGEDGGAVSVSQLPESGYNLEIAMRLQDLIRLMGYETRMIRTKDVSVYTSGTTLAQKKASDLKERVRTVNETDNAVLLSIHQNHFPDPKYQGAQVFFAGTDGSKALAQQIQQYLVKTINPGSKREIKKSVGVYLMEHINCPGVLIECGFLSNPQEEKRLQDPAYQKKLCAGIAAALGQFLSNT